MYIQRYGLSIEQFELLLEKQSHSCAICSQKLKGSKWVIDHDHNIPLKSDLKPHAVRGILCNNCNVGLGRFDDNIELLESALQYLRDHKSKINKKAKTNSSLAKFI